MVGFYVSFKKLTNAVCVAKFLSIVIDSLQMELCLPQDKLKTLQVPLTVFKKKRKAAKQALEVFGRILVHCCKVVHRGRTFCRRVCNLTASVEKNHYNVYLNKEFREDIQWWLSL